MMRLFFVLIPIFCSLLAAAQSIDGIVTDTESKQPIPYASIILKSIGGEFLEGVVTNDEGKYQLKYKDGKYKLHVSFLGFQEYTEEINISGKTTLNIILKAESIELDDVSVTAEKTNVTQLIDKKVINVGNDLLAAGGSAATVLSQLSEVKADEQGNISLRGSQSINLLVNGKPSPLSTSELLQQIPANQINKIEIITSPSAKYRANGMTGIINIITKKKVQKGTSLSINTKVNSLLGYGGVVNFTYGKNKINYRVGGFYRASISKRNNTEERIGSNPYYQKIDYDFDGLVQKINAGMDWFPNKKNEFSTDISYVDNSHTMTNQNEITTESTTFSQRSRGKHSHKTFKANANFRHHFSTENHFLEFDAQLSSNRNNLSGSFTPVNDILDNATNNTVVIYNIALDYTRKIDDKWSVEMGYLWDNQALSNKLFTYNESSSIVAVKSFENTKNVHAGYGLAKYKFSKGGIQVGLRAEIYQRNADFHTNSTSIQNNFNNLFPSLHFNYHYFENFNFTFGYNRRTSRPSLHQVNPISTQVNNFLIRKGNENLLPEFSNNFEITNGYSKNKLDLSATLYYNLRESLILSNYSLGANAVTEISYINNGNSKAMGTEISISYEFTKWLNSDFSTNYNYEKLLQSTNDFGNDIAENVSITLRNQIKISNKMKLDISWNYNGIEKDFFRTYTSTHKYNIGMRYKIPNNIGNINLAVKDVLDSYIDKGTNLGDGFTRKFTYNPVGRVVYLSFLYRFRQSKLKKRSRKSRSYGNGVID